MPLGQPIENANPLPSLAGGQQVAPSPSLAGAPRPQLGSAPPPRAQNFQRIANEVRAELPGVNIPFEVMEGGGEGFSESFPYWESQGHPKPNTNVIQLRPSSRDFSEKRMKSLISGELIHFLGGTDDQGAPTNPKFKKFKDAYIQSLTPEQLAFHRRSYDEVAVPSGEQRPFNQWMEHSRIDQFIGAYLFPSDEHLAAGFNTDADFNPEQKKIMDRASQFLRGKDKLSSQFPQRDPFPSERDFFLKQETSGLPPNQVAQGMATEDNQVILNPFSLQNDKEKSSVKRNEQIRLYLRKNKPNLTFRVTPDQQRAFVSYANKVKSPRERDQAVRDTIMARILSGDPSAGNVTDEQRSIASQIEEDLNQ